MKFLKKESAVLAIIFALSLPGIWAFTAPGFYTSHDGETHTARLANYFLALKEGQFPPQLAPTLFGGYGFPIFIFIYPLPYLLGSIFFQLPGLGYTDAAELVMASGYILSALAMYLFFKLETQKTLPSIMGSLFFIWAPYRFLMMFVRGAFAESFAYLFVATSLVCVNRLIRYQNSKWIGITALSITLMLLSHQLVSAMFLPLILIYAISKLAFLKNKKSITIKLTLSLLLAFMTSAYIYIPTFLERKFLRFDDLINYYQDHFVTLKQLIRSPWGYGFSHPGQIGDDLSFQIGLTHLLVTFLSLLAVLQLAAKRKLNLTKNHTNFKLFIWLIMFIISAYLMLDNPIVLLTWKLVPGLSIIDFPWRFLGVAVTATSFLVTYLLVKTNSNPFLSIALIFFLFYSNRNHTRINQSVYFQDDYFNQYPATATWRNEFLPVERNSNKWAGISGDFQILRGQATISPITKKTNQLELEIQADTESEIVLHRMYFPGWNLTLNQQPLEFQKQFHLVGSGPQLDTNVDLSAFMTTTIQPGQHILQAKFNSTKTRIFGQITTLVGFTSSIILIFFPKNLSIKQNR